MQVTTDKVSASLLALGMPLLTDLKIEGFQDFEFSVCSSSSDFFCITVLSVKKLGLKREEGA